MLVRPVLRAFILGYGSAVAPRVLTLVLQHVSRLRRNRKTAKGQQTSGGGGGGLDGCSMGAAGEEEESFLVSLRRLLRGGFDYQRFPTFCAALVGGSTLFDVSS